jgi:hypothetical protein
VTNKAVFSLSHDFEIVIAADADILDDTHFFSTSTMRQTLLFVPHSSKDFRRGNNLCNTVEQEKNG